MTEGNKETTPSPWFVMCPIDGKQAVPAKAVKPWPKAVVELMGREEYNSATCPKCHSDFEAFRED